MLCCDNIYIWQHNVFAKLKSSEMVIILMVRKGLKLEREQKLLSRLSHFSIHPTFMYVFMERLITFDTVDHVIIQNPQGDFFSKRNKVRVR